MSPFLWSPFLNFSEQCRSTIVLDLRTEVVVLLLQLSSTSKRTLPARWCHLQKKFNNFFSHYKRLFLVLQSSALYPPEEKFDISDSVACVIQLGLFLRAAKATAVVPNPSSRATWALARWSFVSALKSFLASFWVLGGFASRVASRISVCAVEMTACRLVR